MSKDSEGELVYVEPTYAEHPRAIRAQVEIKEWGRTGWLKRGLPDNSRYGKIDWGRTARRLKEHDDKERENRRAWSSKSTSKLAKGGKRSEDDDHDNGRDGENNDEENK